MTGFTSAERITALEVRVQNLESKVDELRLDVKSIDSKLDDILAIKNKGIGAFILMSGIFGTGVLSFLYTIWHYFTGR